MKRNTRPLVVLAICVVAVALFSVTAMADEAATGLASDVTEPGIEPCPCCQTRRAETIADLGFQQLQLKQLEALQVEHIRQTFALREEAALLRTQMRTHVLCGEGDSEQVRQLRGEIAQLAQQLRLQTREHRQELLGMLTQEQAQLVLRLFQGRAGDQPHRGPLGRPPVPPTD